MKYRIMASLTLAAIFTSIGLSLLAKNPRYAAIFAAVMAALLVCVGISVWRSSRRHRAFPKDFAYAVYAEFGPQACMPRDKRLKEEIAGLSDRAVASWLEEFKRVDALVWSLAERGGSEILNHTLLKRELQEAFPFLEHDGLNQALFLVDYYAWHEGYNHTPNPQNRIV